MVFNLMLFSFFMLAAVTVQNNLCEDTSKECKDMKEKCRDDRHSWLMKLKCPASCNSCEKNDDLMPQEECRDLDSKCPEYLKNCSIPVSSKHSRGKLNFLITTLFLGV